MAQQVNGPVARIAAEALGTGSSLYFGTSNSYASGITNTALTINQLGNVGIGTTSPYAKLSLAGAAGGTTNLFALSTSTSGFATTTAIQIDQNGNLSLFNGTRLTTPNLTVGSLNGLLYGTNGAPALLLLIALVSSHPHQSVQPARSHTT